MARDPVGHIWPAARNGRTLSISGLTRQSQSNRRQGGAGARLQVIIPLNTRVDEGESPEYTISCGGSDDELPRAKTSARSELDER